MKINMKKRCLSAGLFLFCVLQSGCALNTGSVADEKELYQIREQNLKADIKSLRNIRSVDNVEPANDARPVIDAPLTLENAVDYALKYNLEAAVIKLERNIQQEAAIGARLKMLPSLTADGEASRRNRYAASYSDYLLYEGTENYSYSSEKDKRTYSLNLSWDLVDFGISYYQYKQSIDRVRIAEQRRKRVIQNLKLDVTKAFWHVQVAQEAVQMADKLVGRLQEREKILKDQLESRTVSEIVILETAAALAEMKIKLSGFERELHNHKLKLASLIGLPGEKDFNVAKVDFNKKIQPINFDLEQLETEALLKRPELYEQDLEERITAYDARITTAKTLPHPSIFWRYECDKNKYLYYDDWQVAGFKVSFNLLSIPQDISHRSAVLQKKKLIKKRRLSIASAILTQLHIAIVDYEDLIRNHVQVKDIGLKRRQLMKARQRHAKFGKGNIGAVLESEAKYLLSRVRTLSSYADVMIATQRVINTIGRNANFTKNN